MNKLDFDEYSRVFGELDELLIPYKIDLIRFDKLDNQKLKENLYQKKSLW